MRRINYLFFLNNKGVINLPQYWESPYYERAQAPLAEMGIGLLKGEVPEYYRDVGEFGGPQFEKMLAMIQRDVAKGTYEDLARRKIGRGGLGADILSRRMADVTTETTFADMLRAIEGRKQLLELGVTTTAGVRGAGLVAGAGRRGFDISKAGLAIGQEQFGEELAWGKERFGQEMAFREKQLAAEIAAKEKERKGSLWKTILSSGIGAISMALAPSTGGASLMIPALTSATRGAANIGGSLGTPSTWDLLGSRF